MTIMTTEQAMAFLMEIGLGQRTVNVLMGATDPKNAYYRFHWLMLPTTKWIICNNLLDGCKTKQIYKCKNLGKGTFRKINDCVTKWLTENPEESEPTELKANSKYLTQKELDLLIAMVSRYKDFVRYINSMPGFEDFDESTLDSLWHKLHMIHWKLLMAEGRKKDE